MEISEARPNTFDEGYIYHFQPEPTHKILAVAEALSLKISTHETSLK